MGKRSKQSTKRKPIYIISDVPGRGKGLVASEDIPKGTRILSEEPVITIPEGRWGIEWLKTHISQQVDSLSERRRQSFLSLYSLYPYENIAEQSLGIFRTNGLPIEAQGIGGGIFLEACRINHACDPNAQKHWNQHIQRHTVHALRDISKGQEITISYLGLDSSREVRQNKLQEKFGFLCSCRLCSLPTEQSQESDRRWEKIDQLDDLIGLDGRQYKFLLRTLRYVDERVHLYNEQGPGNSGLPRAYLDAAQIAIANGDLARGRIFAERAVEGWRTAFGSDCKEVIEYGPLARDPTKLQLYGLSMKWKTSLNEVPQGLDSNDFEDWLWKREKPKELEQLGQLSDFRKRGIFTGFAALPDDESVDLNFYKHVGGICQPLRHWCFLGEIINSTTIHHLELELTDVDNKRTPLHFYTKGLGNEWASAQIQNGYTVAILYARRHVFLYGKPGIRHEDPKMLKIFPAPLKKLLELNDEFQQFSTEVDGMRACHGCSKRSGSLKRCIRCSSFWYCNETCQKAGWNERYHKTSCKFLKDPDLRGLLSIRWDEFKEKIRFPLNVTEGS